MNFWSIYQHAGYVEVADGGEGETRRVLLCRDRRGRLAIVNEGLAFTASAGRLTADFGPGERGFSSEAAARSYLESRVY